MTAALQYVRHGIGAVRRMSTGNGSRPIVANNSARSAHSRPARVATTPASAEKQLKGFIDKFEPRHQTLIRAARKAIRRRLPTAFELAYDNYTFFVLGYGPTTRPSDCIVSLAAGASGLNLFFLQGVRLPDPKRVLLGAGSRTRFVRLASATELSRPEIKALLSAAIAQARTPFSASTPGSLIIRSVSAKQRPRRHDV